MPKIRPGPLELKKDSAYFNFFPPSYKLVSAAILATIAALLQSAGGFLPGIGFLISPFAALPILIVSVYDMRYGILAYMLTVFLLTLIQPDELFIFPFTTGLLGLAIGFGMGKFKSRIIIALVSSLVLLVGICIPLYVLAFPILGPVIPSVPSLTTMLFMFLFCFVYSFIWLLISILVLERVNRLINVQGL